MNNEQTKEERDRAREDRYQVMEQRVSNELEQPMAADALKALRKCPRRSGLPAMGSYFCECPVCTPNEWGLASED